MADAVAAGNVHQRLARLAPRQGLPTLMRIELWRRVLAATQLDWQAPRTTPKQLELLATIVPKLSRVAILTNPYKPNSPAVMKSVPAKGQLRAGLRLFA
jgi:hypothetical protein